MFKEKINFFLVAGIVFITFFVALAVADVGTFPTRCDEAFSWQLPFAVLFIMFVPFIFGYLGGSDD